jgi:predicted secreted protein
MSVTTAIAIYFLIWWITLFAVLPWGVRAQGQEEGDIAPGTDPGAPVLPRILVRLLATTIVSGVIFSALYFVYSRQLVTLDGLASLLGMPR